MKGLILLTIFFPMVTLAQEAENAGFDWSAALSPGGLIAAGVVMVIEFIIGRTDWVEANSMGELVINMVLKMLKKDKAL